mgnify:CR=1 FL=1
MATRLGNLESQGIWRNFLENWIDEFLKFSIHYFEHSFSFSWRKICDFWSRNFEKTSSGKVWEFRDLILDKEWSSFSTKRWGINSSVFEMIKNNNGFNFVTKRLFRLLLIWFRNRTLCISPGPNSSSFRPKSPGKGGGVPCNTGNTETKFSWISST